MTYNENTQVKKNIIIIGAGLAGLTCAKILSDGGAKVIILEKQKTIGGLVSGIKENGFSMDIGPHYMVLPKKSTITSEIQNILGEGNLLEFPNFIQSHRAYFSGKVLEQFPSLKNTIASNGISFIFRVICQILKANIKKMFRKEKSNSGQEYLKNNYGKLLYECWFKPYYSNIFLDEDLPKEYVERQFPPPTLKKIWSFLFSRNMKQDKTKNGNGDQIYFNCYPKFGMVDLIDKLKNHVLTKGGEIILNAEIQTISHKKNEKKIMYIKDENEFQLRPDVIIYGVPPSISLRWFENVPNDILVCGRKSLAYNSIMIYFFVNLEKIFDGWIINIFDPNLIFSRISQQNYLSKHIAPEGKSLLAIEIKCNPTDEVWESSDEKISIVVKNDLEKMNFFDCQKIYDYKIIRIPCVYPKFNTIEFNDQKVVNYINSYDDEYALSHEFDSSELISETVVDFQDKKDHRLGGMLVTMFGAHSLAQKILND